MNAVDHVWAGSATTPSPDTSLWLTTLADIVEQWGWLVAVILVGSLISVAFGDTHPRKER